MILPSGFLKLLQDQFLNQAEAFSGALDTTSAAWHRAVIAEHESDWRFMRSDKTCFVCISRRPQHRLTSELPCGHIICENCVRIFATSVDAWTFEVHHCLLCQADTPGVVIGVIPPTATPRLLSIDGGGARGVIPLVFLQALEDRIGLPYPVQENFDFAFGTSSGWFD